MLNTGFLCYFGKFWAIILPTFGVQVDYAVKTQVSSLNSFVLAQILWSGGSPG